MTKGQPLKRVVALIRNSAAVRFGLLGVLIGACAPVIHTFTQLILFHSDTSIAGYFHRDFLASKEEIVSNLFIGGAAVVMGLSGFLVGRLRENDVRQQARIESANRELSALNSISELIAKTRELDVVLHLALRETLSLSFLNIESKGVIFIRDDKDPDILRMAAKVDLAPYLVAHEKNIRIGYCLCGKAVQAGEIITSHDCFEDKDHTTNYPGMTKHGHIVVPIKSKQDVLGVMTFYLPPDSVPSSDDIRVLSAIASQLAVTIENVRLLQSVSEAKDSLQKKSLELAKNLEVLKTLVNVDRTILTTMDRDEVIVRVATQIRELVKADAGGVALKAPNSGNCCFIGGWGLEIRRGEVLVPAGCHVNPALKAGEPVLRPDLSTESLQLPLDRFLLEAGIKSNAYVPIIRKGRPVGLFFLGSYEEGGISMEDVETAGTFASRMGIALEHAKLIYNLEEMSVNIIHALATAIDAKSPWTKGHSERVADYAVSIGEKMGVNEHLLERLRLAGLLHDIGKIGTYDILLDKEGKLTEEEQELIKQHPDRGCEILAPIKEFKDLLPAVRHHHERWDGRGYPSGLKETQIPIEARILCVADSFDTMTADRPYRPSIGLNNAIMELKYCSGTQFDPEVVEVFLKIIDEKGPAITKGRADKYHPQRHVFASTPDYRL